MNWKNVIKGIKSARVTANIKNVIWRIIIGKLFMGINAYEYLDKMKKYDNTKYKDKFRYCPYCEHDIESTYEHQFWECDTVQAFWDIVKKLFDNINNSYYHELNHKVFIFYFPEYIQIIYKCHWLLRDLHNH